MNLVAPNPNGNATSLAALKERTKNLPPETPLSFFSAGGLDLMQRAAHLLSNSTLVPTAYRDTIERKIDKYTTETVKNHNALSNCVLALNMAQRLGADPLMIMQHLYIVDGHPGWSSQFVISAINTCGKYSPLRFKMEDLGEKEVEWKATKWVEGPNGNRVPKEETHRAKIRNQICTAWAIEKATGDKLEGPPVSMEMAVAEGWYGKNGSKWQTMPDVMLRYRAASFFGKLYAPELLMGLQTAEEAHDAVITMEQGQNGAYEMTMADLVNQPQHAEPEPQATEEKPDKKAASRRKPKAQTAEPAPERQPEPEEAQASSTAATAVSVPAEQPEQSGQPEPSKPDVSENAEQQQPQPIAYQCPRNDRMVSEADCRICPQNHGCPEYWPASGPQDMVSQDSPPNDEEVF